MGSVLELDNLCVSYGSVEAVKGISLHLNEGEIVALIGANGAGKTTTLRTISGLLGVPRHGSITFNGKRIEHLKPYEISKLGIIHVLEGRRIFPHLTVFENLKVGAFLRKDKDVQNDIQSIYKRFPRLEERKYQLGGTLSGGEQQMLAISRALMAKPKLILMDEPSLGLAPLIIKEVFNIIRDINRNGVPILLVEQNSRAALKIANRGYVLETGKVILEDQAQSLLGNEAVIRSYLGG